MGKKIMVIDMTGKGCRHRLYGKQLDRAYVFRPTSEDIKSAILVGAFAALEGHNAYYYGNYGVKWVTQVKKGEINKLRRPNAKNKSVKVDCTGLVTAICKYAGISAIRCGSYDKYMKALTKNGKLKKMSFHANSSSIQPGDVMVRKNGSRGHAWIYVGNVTRAQANSGKVPTVSSTGASSTQSKVTVTKDGKDLGDYAASLCWPYGQRSKGAWGSGKPYPAYKKAMEEVKPQNASKIKIKQWRAGASCDIFVGCACRGFGIKKFPVTLAKQAHYFFQTKDYKDHFTKVTESGKKDNMKHGDVVIGINKGSKNNGQGHIFIVNAEKGHGKKRSNAHYLLGPGYYGVIDDFSDINTGKYKWFGVFRLKPITTGGGTSGGGTSDGGTIVSGYDDGSSLVLTTIDTLFSSEKYKWFSQEEQESESEKKLKEQREELQSFLTNISVGSAFSNSIIPTDVQVLAGQAITSSREFIFKPRQFAGKSGSASLTSYPSFVEAPTIELMFNGITIGGYSNAGDKYPNYITSMTANKINGRINKYTINLNYQIRPGEDPNFIDSLLSRTGYLNPLKIRYGDSSSPGMLFKEENAIVTDVTYKDNVASSSISYTIQAISSIVSANQSYFKFNTVTSKPSTVINNLLYKEGEISRQLTNSFKAMKNPSFVASRNLIPNNDSVVTIGGMINTTPIDYLSHVVSCMTNKTKDSSYFLTYNDSSEGSYFKISELAQTTSTNTLYEVDVGYPGNNFVTNFQLCDNMYWPLVFEYNDKIPRWNYDIDNNGNVVSSKSNSLFSDNKYLNESIINSNWWKSLTEFPISAKLTLKGLTVPAMLMTYIRVNTLFYGQKDIASGIYVVTDQTDSISGSGYSTTLTLLRVGN